MGNQGPVQVEARIKNNLPKTKKVLQKPIKKMIRTKQSDQGNEGVKSLSLVLIIM